MHTITQRQAGIACITGGLGGDLLLFTLGRLGAGRWSGIGPVEGIALLSGLAAALLGIRYLRGGDAPFAIGAEPRYAHGPLPAVRTAKERAALDAARWLRVAAGVVFLLYLAVYVAYAAELFRWPYDYDQGESFELHDAVLHSQGEWPYRDGSAYPFYASNYPPVFHLMILPFFLLFGQRLLAGRVLSFIITLLTAGLIGLTVRRRTGGRFLPALAGLSYLASNFVYHVGPLCRQHLTMVFFETLAVYFIAESEDVRYGNRNLLLGLGALLLAGYTKQLSVFTAVAIFGYLFLRNPWRATKALVGFAVVFGLIFGWLNWATDGQWWINTIAANVNAYLWPQLIGVVRSWFKLHPLYILTAFGYAAYEVGRGELSLYGMWTVCALGSGVMCGKWGGGETYWITSIAASIILSAFALGKLRERVILTRPHLLARVTLLIPLFFLAQGMRMVHLPTTGPVWGPLAEALGVEEKSAFADYPFYDAIGYSQVGHFLLPRDYEGGARIMAYVRATDKPIFSEEAAFAMLAGKPVITNPTQLLHLDNSKLLDTTALEDMIRSEAFGLVIMRAQFYPMPVLVAISEHYQVVEHVPMLGFTYIVMEPRGLTCQEAS